MLCDYSNILDSRYLLIALIIELHSMHHRGSASLNFQWQANSTHVRADDMSAEAHEAHQKMLITKWRLKTGTKSETCVKKIILAIPTFSSS